MINGRDLGHINVNLKSGRFFPGVRHAWLVSQGTSAHWKNTPLIYATLGAEQSSFWPNDFIHFLAKLKIISINNNLGDQWPIPETWFGELKLT